MNGAVRARRVMGLLVLAVAAALVLSAALGADADAKKKKKNINVVQCVINSEGTCFGTDGKDLMVGADSAPEEEIFGGEGSDVYQGNGGNDILSDSSLTSNDIYTGYDPSFTGFGLDEIIDDGGSADFLDLGSLRLLDDVKVITNNDDDLILDGPGDNDIFIDAHFGQGRIEKIKFANGTITGTQAQGLAREATQEEQAAPEDERPDGERPSQDKHSPSK